MQAFGFGVQGFGSGVCHATRPRPTWKHRQLSKTFYARGFAGQKSGVWVEVAQERGGEGSALSA